MKDRQFFENLDTSFIRLDALVRYLSRRNFVGSIYIRFAGYSGEITFTPENRLRVKEQDYVAGRIIGGEKAFASIITRSNEPGGVVNVVQSIKDPAPREIQTAGDNGNGKRVISFANGNDQRIESSKIVPHVRIEPTTARARPEKGRGSLAQLADFPFDLSNHVEQYASPDEKPDVDLELMIDVTGDLLSTIDGALRHAGLDFPSALEKACTELTNKYACLDPQKRTFKYSQGLVYIDPAADLRTLAAGLGDALLRIFERLNSSPKFGKTYRFTTQKVRNLIKARKTEFEQACLASHVERSIGLG